MVYTIFFVFTSCGKMNNFPYANHGFLRLSRYTWSDWPCALLIVIEKASRTWNCNRLISNGMSVGIAGRRGWEIISFWFAVQNWCFDFKHLLFNSKSSSIAHSRWTDVSKNNYGRTNFEWHYILRYSWNVEWIKKINWVIHNFIHIHSGINRFIICIFA